METEWKQVSSVGYGMEGPVWLTEETVCPLDALDQLSVSTGNESPHNATN